MALLSSIGVNLFYVVKTVSIWWTQLMLSANSHLTSDASNGRHGNLFPWLQDASNCSVAMVTSLFPWLQDASKCSVAMATCFHGSGRVKLNCLHGYWMRVNTQVFDYLAMRVDVSLFRWIILTLSISKIILKKIVAYSVPYQRFFFL